MSITYAQFKVAIAHSVVRLQKVNVGTATAATGRLWSRWRQAPFAAGGPGAPVALTSASLGALNRGLPNIPAWVRLARAGHAITPIVVVDRLSHMGGLSGIVTGTVTTNLPTAALTRYTSGAGVIAIVEQDSQVGATASTLSVSYTNSAGVAGRTSPLISFGGAADRGGALSTPIPFQVGDVGIRSVESVTLTSTTNTAGDYGIALVKPVAFIHSWDECHSWDYDAVKDMGSWFESVDADACLSIYSLSNIFASSLASNGSLELIRQV